MRALIVFAVVIAAAYAVPVDQQDLNKFTKADLARYFGIDLVKDAETSVKVQAWSPGKRSPNPEELGHYFEVNHKLSDLILYVMM